MTDNEPYTKIPNAILDAMGELGNAELRVLLAIARRTVGWQKECDVISLTQLENITGLARKNVVKALHDLEGRGLLEHSPAKRNGKCYRLVTLSNQLPSVTSNSTLPELVTLSNQSSPQLVTLSNTQKKDSKERIKKERETHAPTLDQVHEGVTTYKRLTGKRTITPTVAAQIAAAVTDLPYWETVITAWCGKYRAENVSGMLDWYAHPEKMEQRNGTHPNGRPTPNRRPDLDTRRKRERYDLDD